MKIPLYSITSWTENFETSETKKLNTLKWVPVPNKHDGLGFRRTAANPGGPGLFAGWILLLQVASRGRREERGKLLRDGVPLTAEDLSVMTGFPAGVFEEAFAWFSSPRMGWLSVELVEAPENQQPPGRPGINPAPPADAPGRPAAAPALPGRMEGREGKEGREGMPPAPLLFEPIKRGLYLREYEAMLKSADEELKKIVSDDRNYVMVLTTEAENLIRFLTEEGKPDRVNEVRKRKESYRRGTLKPELAQATQAWKARKIAIKAAMNGIATQ